MNTKHINALKKNMPPVYVIILILIFIAIGISRYIFFNIEKDIHNSQMKELEEVNVNVTWSLIYGTIREASLAAQSNTYYISTRIVNDIYKEYPNLEELKRDLDNDMYLETRLPQIIIKNISNKYLFNIRNNNNDIFVITNNGVAVDMNLDGTDTVYRSFDDEANRHFNYKLAYQAFQRLTEHKDYSIIYYEIDKPENMENHEIIVSPSYDALFDVYSKEGINGLKGYDVLVPTYITDDGDIFGTPDINEHGKRIKNHKLIVVQRFNIYDVLMHIHEKDLKLNEENMNSMKDKLINAMQVRTIIYTFIMLIDLIGLMLLVFYMSFLLKHNKRNDE